MGLLDVLCVIMGGGRGTRLFPLTKYRCKPAVPLAGKYRLVDVPISNCLNAGLNKIYILTQFNTRSLHRHIENTYRFDTFGGGGIEIFSAEQTDDGIGNWYEGNADAVRKNMRYFNVNDEDIMVILSGDQLYRMDIADFIRHHVETKADLTIASKAVINTKVSAFGVIKIEKDFSISKFVEKPTDPSIMEEFTLNGSLRNSLKDKSDAKYSLVSMGIYVFKAGILKRALAGSGTDFGKEIIPSLLGRIRLKAYIFDDYWEDIGTVRSFFETNLMLAQDVPQFNFFDEKNPIYTHPRALPASKINSCSMKEVLISEGSIISESTLRRCVIGQRGVVGRSSLLENVLMMGANMYETSDDMANNKRNGIPNVGVGDGCYIRNCIIDKNARIGNNVKLTPDRKDDGFDYDGIYVRDGILCVGQDAIIPDNTSI
ncbi:MAG: glucose-1-phosphate adenylyltransferase [Puniceicoccales bacterium]|nr:glucose-1-phosphate adenylyltransferase [Puniceicoccales bacterium]